MHSCISACIQLTTNNLNFSHCMLFCSVAYCLSFYIRLLHICWMSPYLSVRLCCCDVTTITATDDWDQFPRTCMCQTYWADKPDSDSDLLIILVLTAGCSVLENTDLVYETKLPFCSFEIHRLTLSAKLGRIQGDLLAEIKFIFIIGFSFSLVSPWLRLWLLCVLQSETLLLDATKSYTLVF